EEIARANYPQIRLMNVPFVASPTPLPEVENAAWSVCSPEAVRSFSAVGYYFGRELHKDKHVPVGIIHASRGATPAEAWTSPAMLNTIEEFRSKVRDLPDQDEWD